jgi:hypothetical protein
VARLTLTFFSLSEVYIFLHFNELVSYFIFSIFLFVNRRWDKFEDSYRVMIFSNGDKCWNGPDRSLKVLAAVLISRVMLRFSLTRMIPYVP